jgi:hypothetical protein
MINAYLDAQARALSWPYRFGGDRPDLGPMAANRTGVAQDQVVVGESR